MVKSTFVIFASWIAVSSVLSQSYVTMTHVRKLQAATAAATARIIDTERDHADDVIEALASTRPLLGTRTAAQSTSLSPSDVMKTVVSAKMCNGATFFLPPPVRPNCNLPVYQPNTERALPITVSILRPNPVKPESKAWACKTYEKIWTCSVTFFGGHHQFVLTSQSPSKTKLNASEQEMLFSSNATKVTLDWEGDYECYYLVTKEIIAKYRVCTLSSLVIEQHSEFANIIFPDLSISNYLAGYHAMPDGLAWYWKPAHQLGCSLIDHSTDACVYVQSKTEVAINCPHSSAIFNLGKGAVELKLMTGCTLNGQRTIYLTDENIIIGVNHDLSTINHTISDLPRTSALSLTASQIEYAFDALQRQTKAELESLAKAICLNAQAIWTLAMSDSAVDPTGAARTLYRREDIIADFVNGGFIIKECRNIARRYLPNPAKCGSFWPTEEGDFIDIRNGVISEKAEISDCNLKDGAFLYLNDTHFLMVSNNGRDVKVLKGSTYAYSFADHWSPIHIAPSDLYTLEEIQKDQISRTSLVSLHRQFEEMKRELGGKGIIDNYDFWDAPSISKTLSKLASSVISLIVSPVGLTIAVLILAVLVLKCIPRLFKKTYKSVRSDEVPLSHLE